MLHPPSLNSPELKSRHATTGESLTAFYNNRPDHWRSSIFCEHRLENNELLPKTECFRDETHKFIRYEDSPSLFELYNLEEDVNETNNLALDKSYADKVAYYAAKCDSVVAGLMSDRVQAF